MQPCPDTEMKAAGFPPANATLLVWEMGELGHSWEEVDQEILGLGEPHTGLKPRAHLGLHPKGVKSRQGQTLAWAKGEEKGPRIGIFFLLFDYHHHHLC